MSPEEQQELEQKGVAEWRDNFENAHCPNCGSANFRRIYFHATDAGVLDLNDKPTGTGLACDDCDFSCGERDFE